MIKAWATFLFWSAVMIAGICVMFRWNFTLVITAPFMFLFVLISGAVGRLTAE